MKCKIKILKKKKSNFEPQRVRVINNIIEITEH